MKLFDRMSRACRLDGGQVSDASLDVAVNAAYEMLARNDELALPFEEWEEEIAIDEDSRVVSYYSMTSEGNQIRISFDRKDMLARIMLFSGEEECNIGDQILGLVISDKKYPIEEWL
jgi:hypothetical protein